MPKINLSSFIGKNDKELEKALGFTHYIETKDKFLAKKKVDPEKLVDVLFKFIGSQKLKAVKTDNSKILEIFDISLEEVKENLLLLGKKNGMFYDEDLSISYSILGENFYAYLYFVLMFSAGEENVQKMAKILGEYTIEYHEPHALGKENFIEQMKQLGITAPVRKIGRNEPCPCGSGKKYKKCCLRNKCE